MISTQDAVWCVEQLWWTMLHSLQSSVQSKEGLGNKLPDLVKLLELMSHGGPNKWAAKAPSFHVDLTTDVHVPHDQRAALREVFIYYCTWAEKCRFLHMTRSQFLRFARDTLIMNVSMPAPALEGLFAQVIKEWPDETPNANLTMLAWMKALQAIATTMYPQLPVQHAWERLLGEHVFTFAGSSGMLDEDKLGLVLLSPSVIGHLEAARSKLRALFDFYANESEFCYMYGVQRKRPSPPAPPQTNVNLSPSTSLQLPPPSPTTAASRLLPAFSLQPGSFRRRQGLDGLAPTFSGSIDGGGYSYSGCNTSGCGVQTSYSGALPGQVQQQVDGAYLGWGGDGDSPKRLPSGMQPPRRAQSPSMTKPGTAPASTGVAPTLPRWTGSVSPATPSGMFRPHTQATEDAVVNNHLCFPAYMRMLQELGVLPNILSKAQACVCFCASHYGPGQCLSMDSLNSGHFCVNFEEFAEAIVRCALTAFNYQELPPPKTLMVFKDSYQAGAKHMWAADARTELQNFLNQPSQVALPPAMYEDCIGREDAAHYDEVDGSDARSVILSPRTGAATHRPRTAASVRSMASNIYRSAKSLRQVPGQQKAGSGPEMLTVHAEADTLDNSITRPLHLRKFNVAWIGEPKLPLNELAKTRAAFNNSRKSKEVFLPPMFKQQAADMILARTNRAKAMEDLRLTYVAVRRRQQLAALTDAAARRRDLQMQSMQPYDSQEVLSPWTLQLAGDSGYL